MWRVGILMSKIISFILQPLLMPLYSVSLLFIYTNFFEVYHNQLLRFLIPIFTFSFFLPLLFIIVLWRLKYIRNLDDVTPSERVFPYLIFFTSNISLVYFFYSAGLYYWFLGLVAAPAVIALVGLIINFFWKISAHMLGIGGLIGGVLSVAFNVKGINPWILFVILFILAGILGVCRLYLRKSTPAQIYAGFIIGMVLAFGTVFLSVFSLVLSFK